MKNLRLFVALAVLCPATAFAQAITAVTSPASNTTIKAADDFATRAFQDPWDMNQKTDVGPFLGSRDAGSSNWAPGFTFSGGLFSGTTTADDAQLWFLDTGNPLAVPVGKTGTNYPINASTYKVFAVRMTVQNSSQAQVLTWPQTIYDSSPTSHFSGFVSAGTGVYFINLDLTSPAGGSANWTGTQRALRFQPTGRSGEAVTVDWARLVPAGNATSCQPISWTGAGDADIYLDTDTDPSGFYGLAQSFASQTNSAATRASAGCPVLPGVFNFYVGALPAGTYRVFVVPVGVTPSASTGRYAPGAWTVGDVPTMKFITPTDEGSSDDFASSQLGDAWDMDKLTDVDTLVNVNSAQITTLTMEAPDGSSLGPQRVFMGSNAPGLSTCPDMLAPGDPQMTLLSNLKRGATKLIDANRYRLLTLEFGIPNAARDVLCGSVARVVWRQKGDQAAGSVSDDIIFNQRAGVNLLDKLTIDLRNVLVEQGTGAGGTNWTNGTAGGIEIFRFDPHEFTPPTNFYVKRIKLADFERAKTQYVITWTYSKSVGSVDFFYDPDNTGFDGTPINGTPINAALGTFTWDVPTNLPTSAGTPYYIYAVFSDVAGTVSCPSGSTTCNSNRVYAPLPVVMDSNYTVRPRLALSRQTLNFGVLGNTPTTSGSQTVRLTFVGPGSTPCWVISNSNQNFTVSPAFGTGNATVTVSLVPQTFPGGGAGTATFTVNECNSNASTFLNPGQQFTATYRITSGAAPVGAVDTPSDNIQGVVGSLGVTGWAVDDIDVTGVRIYRNAVAGEAADALGRVFLGDANRVDDARSDIEAANPTAPFNYRGGWGYLLLTNFLPGLGNGTFVLKAYATDADGHETLLGQRTITTTNSSSTEPFGAIDTPGQGATVSGNLNNFGWVLARGSVRADPPGGGAVSVVVDGAIIGSPGQWSTRSDLTSLFPVAQYSGINTALGVFTFNTVVYQDGIHTISWVILANNGQAAGIGSRYFTTVNGTNLTLTDSPSNVVSAAPAVNPFANLGRAARDLGRVDTSARVRATAGYSVRPPSLAIAADPTGLRTVYARALQRVVVDASTPGAHRYEAYLVAGGTLGPLPIGASFDDTRGLLSWQPGVGFSGAYDFIVMRDGQAKVPVRVVLTPETYRAPVNRLVRGLFATN